MPPSSTSSPTPDAASLGLVEAARYALLRRLAFAMRHHMVVHLQPIGMITEVMDRRLRAPAPDLAQVHEGMTRIGGFTRAAVESCMDVVSWLAPEPGCVVALDAGVQECLGLLRSHFSFRGITLHDEVGLAPMTVDRAGLRDVLPACLLALTDHAGPTAANLLVSVEPAATQAVLSLQLQSTDGPAGFPGEAAYRLLQWPEVEALARAAGIALTRQGDSVRLVLPRAEAAAAPA